MGFPLTYKSLYKVLQISELFGFEWTSAPGDNGAKKAPAQQVAYTWWQLPPAW